ncbi:hypothetical protein C4577_06450 [Candidatus Parcubacteria bacterium]|nr:MAG: hypothetical protein C4577_06450 [Candidatus Parcubacteria bacterium]
MDVVESKVKTINLSFEKWWGKAFGHVFKEGGWNSWESFMKEFSETAYKEGRRSMVQELIESGELPEEY